MEKYTNSLLKFDRGLRREAKILEQRMNGEYQKKLSKVENIITGERMMTEGNALKHYLTKGKKALKSK